MELRELSWKERGRLWVRLGIRLLLTAAILLLLFLVVPRLLSLFMPFVLAFVMAWLLNPLVRWLHRRLHISRRLISLLIILLVFAIVGGVLFGFFYGIGSEIYSLVTNWATVEGDILGGLNAVGEQLQRLFDLLPDRVTEWIDGLYERLMVWLQEVVPQLLASAGKGAGNFAMSVPSWLVAAVVFLMASYFITADYPRIRFLATDRMSTEVRGFLGRVRDVAVAAFGGYVKAQLILSIGVFFILLIGFALIGQSYALLLAFLLAVMDFIPIIGAGTAMVPWAVVDVVMGDYRKALELMVIWGIICLFRRVAEPKVVGNQTGLSPILSLVSIYVGMRLAGVLGMILGPVALLIVINIVKMDVFSGVHRDISLAVQDVRALLATDRGENSKNL